MCRECLRRRIGTPLYRLDQTAVRRISQRFSKSDVPKQPSGHETINLRSGERISLPFSNSARPKWMEHRRHPRVWLRD